MRTFIGGPAYLRLSIAPHSPTQLIIVDKNIGGTHLGGIVSHVVHGIRLKIVIADRPPNAPPPFP